MRKIAMATEALAVGGIFLSGCSAVDLGVLVDPASILEVNAMQLNEIAESVFSAPVDSLAR